jgi:plastocyanin
MKYHPAQLNVKKGDTVIWINKDFVPHDVTEETTQKWTSKPFNQGEQWSKVVNEDVKYFCNLHKVMKGTITIIK